MNKIKFFIVAAIIFALVAITNPRFHRVQAEPVPEAAAVGCLIVIVVIGGVVVVWGMWKICDRAFPAPPPPPPKTNPPPPGTNAPATNRPMVLELSLPVYTFRMVLEESDEVGGPWQPAGYIDGNVNSNTVTFVTKSVMGEPLLTNVAEIGTVDGAWIATNDLRAVIGSEGKPQQFWRVK